MHFEAHVLDANQFVAHKTGKMSLNGLCGYLMSHKLVREGGEVRVRGD